MCILVERGWLAQLIACVISTIDCLGESSMNAITAQSRTFPRQTPTKRKNWKISTWQSEVIPPSLFDTVQYYASYYVNADSDDSFGPHPIPAQNSHGDKPIQIVQPLLSQKNSSVSSLRRSRELFKPFLQSLCGLSKVSEHTYRKKSNRLQKVLTNWQRRCSCIILTDHKRTDRWWQQLPRGSSGGFIHIRHEVSSAISSTGYVQ